VLSRDTTGTVYHKKPVKLREYQKIGDYTSIDKTHYAHLGMQIKPQKTSDLLRKLEADYNQSKFYHDRSESTCSDGRPRYAMSLKPPHAYRARNCLEEGDVSTPWGGTRKALSDLRLIKGLMKTAPPDEIHFMEQLKSHDQESLWLECLDPQTHWSDRLAKTRTASHLVRLQEKKHDAAMKIKNAVRG